MDLKTIKAKINANHARIYEKIFNRINIKDGDSILLVTWFHPYYYHMLKKTYPHSFILNIEDIDIVNLLWDNDLNAVVALDLEDKNSLIKYSKENKMKFDHIIANPPYSLGNQITFTILNNVDFDEYVNLMPVSYYRGNKIYQHLQLNTLEKVEWEGDASVIPYLTKLNKKADTNITWDSTATYRFDMKFSKFYLEGMKREKNKFYIESNINEVDSNNSFDINTTFVLPVRALAGGVGGPGTFEYSWNVLKTATMNDVPTTWNDKNHTVRVYGCRFYFFKTTNEKDNFTKWWYSSAFLTDLLKGMNKQGGSPSPAIPKVDWTHEWTDEEILKDYGYTDEEIRELLK